MLIVNADDWGRSQPETDLALACYRRGGISSISAMAFMEDSDRAAALAKDNGMDVGLHLNVSENYSGPNLSGGVVNTHAKILRFVTASKCATLFTLISPRLEKRVSGRLLLAMGRASRLYGKEPSHVDGHHHRHLSMNILVDGVIPRGTRVRRNFSFTRSEKGAINRVYRSLLDRYLSRRYRMTDYFFSLAPCREPVRLRRVIALAEVANVEVMIHPQNTEEYKLLMSDLYRDTIATVRVGNHAQL